MAKARTYEPHVPRELTDDIVGFVSCGASNMFNGWCELDWNWIGLENGLDWRMDWVGLGWIGLDWVGLGWIGLRFGAVSKTKNSQSTKQTNLCT